MRVPHRIQTNLTRLSGGNFFSPRRNGVFQHNRPILVVHGTGHHRWSAEKELKSCVPFSYYSQKVHFENLDVPALKREPEAVCNVTDVVASFPIGLITGSETDTR